MVQLPVVMEAREDIILFWGFVRDPVAATRNWISRPEMREGWGLMSASVTQ